MINLDKLESLTDYISSYIQIRSKQITKIIESHIINYRVYNKSRLDASIYDPYKNLDEIQQKIITRFYGVYNLVRQHYDDNNQTALASYILPSNFHSILIEFDNLDKIISKNSISYQILKCNS